MELELGYGTTIARHHLQQRTKPNCSSDQCCPQKRATMAIVATDSTYGTSDDPQWTMPAAVGHGTCNTSNNTDSNYTPLGYSGDDIICSSDDVLLRCNAQQQQYTCIWGHLFLHVVGDTTGTFMVEHERGRWSTACSRWATTVCRLVAWAVIILPQPQVSGRRMRLQSAICYVWTAVQCLC